MRKPYHVYAKIAQDNELSEKLKKQDEQNNRPAEKQEEVSKGKAESTKDK